MSSSSRSMLLGPLSSGSKAARAASMSDTPRLSIVSTWVDTASKRAVFDVTTADGTAQLTMDFATPGLLCLWAVLPSGRSYAASLEDELTALALEDGDDDEFAAHLRTALA